MIEQYNVKFILNTAKIFWLVLIDWGGVLDVTSLATWPGFYLKLKGLR